jgi:hypothetical protein
MTNNIATTRYSLEKQTKKEAQDCHSIKHSVRIVTAPQALDLRDLQGRRKGQKGFVTNHPQ